MLLLSGTWTTWLTEMAIQISVHSSITVIYCNKPWSQQSFPNCCCLRDFLYVWWVGIHKQNALRVMMKSCLFFIRTEFPGKNYLWAGKICVPALCECRSSWHCLKKDQNSDILLSSDNETLRLMISVQGGSHPISGVCTVQLWERILPYCPHQVREG